MTPEERFWSRVDKTSTCWLWTGQMSKGGYGRFYFDGRLVQAHRFAYYGRFLDGEPALDHICRIRRCVNPDHLQRATNRENVLAGIGPTAVNARKTECRRGHPLTSANVYEGRYRRCRECAREARRANYQLHAEDRRAYARARRLRIIDGEDTDDRP